MKRVRVILLISVLTGGAVAQANHDGEAVLISRATTGARANGHSAGVSLSADGTLIAFASNATNLVPGDTNAVSDVFIRDMTRATTERISVTSSEAEAEGGGSRSPVMSPDGRYVLFASAASNLGGTVDGGQHLYLRDRERGTTELISVTESGLPSAEGNGRPSISDDGRFVVFTSWDQLIADDDNEAPDIYIRDRTAATLRRLFATESTSYGSYSDPYARISGDGRWIALSTADALLPDDSNEVDDVYLIHRESGVLERATAGLNGEQVNGQSYLPQLSRDGSILLFESLATNIVPGPPGRAAFVLDAKSGHIDRIDLPSIDYDTRAKLSANGRFVAFQSDAAVTSDDESGRLDVYIWDRLTRATTLVTTKRADAIPEGMRWLEAVSVDGRFVAMSIDPTHDDPREEREVFMVTRHIERISTHLIARIPEGVKRRAPVTLEASLTSGSDMFPVRGQPLTFEVAGMRSTARTDREGRARVTIRLDVAPGRYPVSVSFDGDESHEASQDRLFDFDVWWPEMCNGNAAQSVDSMIRSIGFDPVHRTYEFFYAGESLGTAHDPTMIVVRRPEGRGQVVISRDTPRLSVSGWFAIGESRCAAIVKTSERGHDVVAA